MKWNMCNNLICICACDAEKVKVAASWKYIHNVMCILLLIPFSIMQMQNHIYGKGQTILLKLRHYYISYQQIFASLKHLILTGTFSYESQSHSYCVWFSLLQWNNYLEVNRYIEVSNIIRLIVDIPLEK